MLIGMEFEDMSIRQINKKFREADDSKLWPINGRFNVTERAIRHVRQYLHDYGAVGGYEYASMVEAEISRIVNDPSLY